MFIVHRTFYNNYQSIYLLSLFSKTYQHGECQPPQIFQQRTQQLQHRYNLPLATILILEFEGHQTLKLSRLFGTNFHGCYYLKHSGLFFSNIIPLNWISSLQKSISKLYRSKLTWSTQQASSMHLRNETTLLNTALPFWTCNTR